MIFYSKIFVLPNIANWQKHLGLIWLLRREGDCVLNDKIVLSPEEIYEKEFKIDARGYRPQEVDNFLDTIIKDYTEFIKLIRSYDKHVQTLTQENSELKAQIRKLQTELEESSSTDDENVSNIDLLRRISQLEKIVYNRLK